MQTVQYYHPRFGTWSDRSQSKTWRYVAAGVLAFVFIWPVLIPVTAIALLIWGKRAITEPMNMMRSWHEQHHSDDRAGARDFRDKMRMKMRSKMRGWGCGGSHRGGPHHAFRTSGNEAFDAYKADTLRRLEEEQQQFEDFLARLREAKDKAEFDAFMEDQAKRKSEEDKPEGLDDDGPIEAKK